ncbi:hypothetical protein SFRURICE_001897 [Spodoptera frugiperda]|uniref:SFRICE_028565 n=1 Tax=Spodoptera frugiperda TaxID=7108 RepID=A0A2H1WV92_SPOFR|nr:hypothetical protein SFRURICE_001897 [Spodoptera frugiperda]
MQEKVAIKYIIHRLSHESRGGLMACLLTLPPLYGVKAPPHCRQPLSGPEIAKVRASLFQINGVKKEPLVLPEPEGVVTTLTEKVYVPVKEHPDVILYRKKCEPNAEHVVFRIVGVANDMLSTYECARSCSIIAH